MTGFEMLMSILWQVIWPLKGIIYMEEQILQWGLAFALVYFKHYGYILLIIVALYFVVTYIILSRMLHMPIHIGGILHFFITIFCVILGAWVLLIFGALVGNHRNRGESVARRTLNYRRPLFGGLAIVRSITYVSLHFRLGRAIYRGFYRLIGYIPFLGRTEYTRFREVVARILALFVILYGVWNIPYDLTH